MKVVFHQIILGKNWRGAVVAALVAVIAIPYILTRIYNAKHPQGVTLSDNIITDMGVNIGDYAPGANAWIYFDTVTPEMASNENIIYRNIIQACGGYGSKEKSADVIVDACEA